MLKSTLPRGNLSFLGKFPSHLAQTALPHRAHPSPLSYHWSHSALFRYSFKPLQSSLALQMSHGYKVPSYNLFFPQQALFSIPNSLNLTEPWPPSACFDIFWASFIVWLNLGLILHGLSVSTLNPSMGLHNLKAAHTRESEFIWGKQINLMSWLYGLLTSINSRVKFSFQTPIRVRFIRLYT